MLAFLKRRDVVSGLSLLTLGLFALWESSHYRFGALSRMGPGFFPSVISFLIAACGGILVIRSIVGADEPLDKPEIRSVLAGAGGVVAFAICLRPLGLLIATAALILASNLAGRPLRVRTLLGLFVVLSALIYVLFIEGLGMPIPLLPG
ncbi:MAG: tripartite tricarboxylate transporter TctB family protein [Alphaproteobacteria bacterium]